MEEQAMSTMTWYPIHLHYPETEPDQLFLWRHGAKHLAEKWKVPLWQSLVWFNQDSNFEDI